MSSPTFSRLHSPAQSTLHSQKVLVIDDVEMNVSVIASMVATLCEVLTATSGQQGLEIAAKHQPDLILLDIMMPGMDGFEVFRRLRSTPATAHIPVIFLTGATDMSAEEISLNMGAADFIAKPFRAPVLLARIRNHLELARQRVLLERLSHHDSLTGIANRRYFNLTLSREFSRMQRKAQPIALILLHVDLQAIHEQFGYAHGDECLRHIAHTMARCLQRPGNLVARYAPEVFAGLLPETAQEEAQKIADELQATLRQLPLSLTNKDGVSNIPFHLGVTAVAPDTLQHSQDLISMAEERLQQAMQRPLPQPASNG